MRAVVGEEADLAVGVAEGDQVLAEDAEANRIAVGVRQLLRAGAPGSQKRR